MINVKEKYVRWIGILVLGFCLTFIVKDKEHERLPFIYNFLITLIFTAVFWNGCFLIIMGLRKKYPKISQTAKRLVFTFLIISLFLLLGANVVRLSIGLNSLSDLQILAVVFKYVEINFISAMFVSMTYESVYFFSMWTDSVKQNEALKNQQMKTQFEVLQNQMSPHFLFNSLNTLTTLIAENQDLAISFTQQLSEVYRYILQNKEKELVQLKEELIFSEAYVYLLQMRYPDNLTVSFSISDEYKEYYIAPLTLQILIENSIKHNIISKLEPLEIKVYIENNSIIVYNNLQIKNTIKKSTKTGLDNITKRYEILGKRKINVVKSENSFIVAIPLIKIISEFDYLKEVKS